MIKRHLTLYATLFLLTLSFAYASDWGVKNKPIEVWSDAFNGTTYYNCSQYNITIVNPQKNITVVNAPMQPVNISGGKIFFYNFTPNVTGNWYASGRCYSASALVGTGSQTFAVREMGTMEISILLGIIFFILTMVYFAKDMFTKPKIADEHLKETSKYVQPERWGVLFMVLGAWGLVILASFMKIISIGTEYGGLMNLIQIISVIVVSMFTLLYVAYYFIVMFDKSIRLLVKK